MGWKIYSWVLMTIIIVSSLIDVQSMRFLDVVDSVVVAVSMLGVICYAHKKRIVNSLFWKVFFPLSGIWTIGSLSFISVFFRGEDFAIGAFIIGLVLLFPMYIGLFIYAFRFFKPFPFARKPTSLNSQRNASETILSFDPNEKLRRIFIRSWYIYFRNISSHYTDPFFYLFQHNYRYELN